MKNKEPKLKIVFEDGEPTKEEQIKFMFQLLDLMIDGYQDILYRDRTSLSAKEKEEIKGYIKLSPIIKKFLANYDKELQKVRASNKGNKCSKTPKVKQKRLFSLLSNMVGQKRRR